MQREELLIELGVEEIPAGYIGPALERFCSSIAESLRSAGLAYAELQSYSTPRRFAVKIKELESEQPDEVQERIGPSVEIAYDAAGSLTRAALGFLKSAGAGEADIYMVESSKGKKIAVRLEKKGRKLAALLPEMVDKAAGAMNFPRTMRWGATKMNFARPLRWLVCVYGRELVDICLNGITSGRTSYGNRYRKLVNPVEFSAGSEYPQKLEEVEVIADRAERKQMIVKRLGKIEAETGLEVINDARLLEEVTDLVEYPTATLGSFEKKYLQLPEKIIISTLSQNQKCFALRDEKGSLTNKFIFTNNGNPACEEIIRHGNEKVISARLADAEFYYEEDTRYRLEHYTKKLSEVLFQKDLGNLAEKTSRIRALSEGICDELGIGGERREDILRCAELCKADLVTLMLGEKEFTKLQGYIGMKYALVSGEKEIVAQGIYEHYQPRGQSDELPESEPGIIVALADKLDTVCGIMGVGQLPTGSNDPFALRRAANGIVSILASKEIELDLEMIIERTFMLLAGRLPQEKNNFQAVQEFFDQRIIWLLKQEGIGYDVIDSVMHIGKSNIPDLVSRATAVERFREREDFIRLVLGFKRVSNIISEQQEFGEVSAALLEQEAEKELYEGYRELSVRLAGIDDNYSGMLEELVQYSRQIDRFFDEVLVNADNEELRSNRYNLLKKIREEFLRVADLALIVVEEKK